MQKPVVRGRLIITSYQSTAKPYHSIQPHDLNEQVLWNQVLENPSSGNPLPLSNDAK
jgi:hypothetical protein